VLDPESRQPLFEDDSLTENTRAAYPLSFLNGGAGGLGSHPKKVIFLTADAFGVLPPLARLSRDQALYWFLTGYTSKLAGTERGVTSPSSTFSACFGEPFLPLPPMRYASLLGQNLDLHRSDVWLVNTGWTGGPYGVGKRIPLQITRSIVNAVLDDDLDGSAVTIDPTFGFSIPQSMPNVPDTQLRPRESWADTAAYDTAARQLARDMAANFEQFPDVSSAVHTAGPATQ
jgi:phosphoenolpyruvate carboxykinase (ATP)